jgi:hypothetical protein
LNQPSQAQATPYFFNGIAPKETLPAALEPTAFGGNLPFVDSERPFDLRGNRDFRETIEALVGELSAAVMPPHPDLAAPTLTRLR